jgi:DNA polymerase-1
MAGPAKRLYLIDGSSYVYRAFFALPPLTSPSGQPTNAAYGFTTMLLKLLAEAEPEHLAVVFDAPGETFRDRLYTAYKANRAAAPSDLVAQIEPVRAVVAGLGIRALVVPGVEADDVIATLTTRFAAEGVECVVVTGDKDLMQLVGPRVRLWDTMRDRWTDETAVEQRLGVRPEQVVEVMALMGDAVDNIPGIKGIGEKTAVALIRAFGDLDGVLEHLPAVAEMPLRGAKKVAALLREGAAQARLSRQLALVRRDLPIDCRLADLRCAGPDLERLRALFAQLGFQSLLRQLPRAGPALAVETTTVRDAPAASAYLSGAAEWLALATAAAEGPAVTTAATELFACGPDGRATRIPLGDPAVRAAVASALTAPARTVLAHDLKTHLLRLQAAGIALGGRAVDVMIASYLLDATARHELAALAADVLGVHLADGDTAALGVTLLRPLWERFAPRLRDEGLQHLFEAVEMPLVGVLAEMERRGVALDVERLGRMSEEFATRMDQLMREIHAAAGVAFNINSPTQLREVLFERLELSKKGVRRGKTGYSTDVDVLTRLAAVHPLPAKILEYRSLAKLKSTYVDALPAAVNPRTGRLHTTFNQTVAATGRLSSSDPNLQNIPVRGEEGRRIREAFVAPPGCVLLAADYSQIELRVLAHLSQDAALLAAFRGDEDVHTRTASEVFGVLPGTVTAEMRRAAKVINFGIIYGMGPQRLAQELGISPAEAQRYIANYFDRYAGVRAYLHQVVAEARECGHVTTVLGRRRAVPELRSTDRAVAQAAERVATNTPIQGSAADLIKLAMVNVTGALDREQVQAGLVLQVHDELLFEVAAAEVERAAALIRTAMEGVMALRVPLRVELGTGRNWAEAH